MLTSSSSRLFPTRYCMWDRSTISSSSGAISYLGLLSTSTSSRRLFDRGSRGNSSYLQRDIVPLGGSRVAFNATCPQKATKRQENPGTLEPLSQLTSPGTTNLRTCVDGVHNVCCNFIALPQSSDRRCLEWSQKLVCWCSGWPVAFCPAEPAGFRVRLDQKNRNDDATASQVPC
jgi:hypothetical protein